ncbi:MAG: UPF0716 protein FxsA [Gammaproteobacteria bacterium]
MALLEEFSLPFITLIFLIVPVLEIYLLIQVGQVIGALWTVFFVVFTAVIGIRLLKVQGLSTLSRAQQKMSTGQMPAEEMLEGMGLIVAGAFLLTPGFFTDTVGFLLLFPPTRRSLVALIVQKVMTSGSFVSAQSNLRPETRRESNVIEGVHYERDDKK